MSENGLRTGLLMDRRQVASHAALQKVLEELALGEMKRGE
jgi:hypothetical protein